VPSWDQNSVALRVTAHSQAAFSRPSFRH
jgi:hypothetical protein